MKVSNYLFVLMIALNSCKSSKDIITENFKGNYQVVELNEHVTESMGVTFLIDSEQKRVSGNSGCNTYSAGYSISEDQILSFSPMMMTKMYCMEEKKNDIERKFQKVLTNSFQIQVKKNSIQLTGVEDKSQKIVLKKKDN